MTWRVIIDEDDDGMVTIKANVGTVPEPIGPLRGDHLQPAS